MFKILKRTLTHSIQTMDHHFMCLDLSLGTATDLQIRRLDALGISIDGLRFLLEGLPMSRELVDRVVLHDIRNQLARISTDAQLLFVSYKATLGCEAKSYLEGILIECERITEALEKTKTLATATI